MFTHKNSYTINGKKVEEYIPLAPDKNFDQVTIEKDIKKILPTKLPAKSISPFTNQKADLEFFKKTIDIDLKKLENKYQQNKIDKMTYEKNKKALLRVRNDIKIMEKEIQEDQKQIRDEESF
jgi:hypothetical protein